MRDCEERDRLIDEWNKALTQYSDAARWMSDSTIVSRRSKKSWQFVAAEHARLKAESARRSLEQHRAEHGC